MSAVQKGRNKMVIALFLIIIVPNTNKMEEKAGESMKEFNSLVFPPGYDANIGKRKVSCN